MTATKSSFITSVLKGHGFSRAADGAEKLRLFRLRKNSIKSPEASGHDFTGCGKTRSGGRPGIYPRYKANGISGGFSHWGMFFRLFF
jgi:hypothetical protein